MQLPNVHCADNHNHLLQNAKAPAPQASLDTTTLNKVPSLDQPVTADDKQPGEEEVHLTADSYSLSDLFPERQAPANRQPVNANRRLLNFQGWLRGRRASQQAAKRRELQEHSSHKRHRMLAGAEVWSPGEVRPPSGSCLEKRIAMT